MNKEELQKQYLQVKEELDYLQNQYWKTSLDECTIEIEFKIINTFTLLKSINKRMYYEE